MSPGVLPIGGSIGPGAFVVTPSPLPNVNPGAIVFHRCGCGFLQHQPLELVRVITDRSTLVRLIELAVAVEISVHDFENSWFVLVPKAHCGALLHLERIPALLFEFVISVNSSGDVFAITIAELLSYPHFSEAKQ